MTSESNQEQTEPSLHNSLVLAALGAVTGIATGLICAMVFIYVGLMGDEAGSLGALVTVIVILIGLITWGATGAKSIGGRVALISACLAGAIGGIAFMGLQHFLWNTVSTTSGIGALIGGAVAALIVNKRNPASQSS